LQEFYNFSTSINSFLKIIKDAFILAFIKHFLKIIRKQAANILNASILNAKVKLYYLILANFILKIKKERLKFLKLL
jgi:hypothetical protein